MSEEEDLDLLALQRQLDDAFQTTRPRPAFEDELWLRIQSRRPIWQRLRESLSGLVEGFREAPAVPSVAVAIALIVIVGVGILTRGGLHFAGSGGSTAALAPADNAGPGSAARLPAPAFSQIASPTVPLGGGVKASPVLTLPVPSVITWTGRLNVTAATLPVFRYQEPTSADANQFAVSLGIAPAIQPAQGALGTYTEDALTLVVTGSTPQPAREPSFTLTDSKSSAVASGSDPIVVATAYLSSHSLIPTWPYQVDVQRSGATVRVRFLRLFDLASEGQVSLINGVGDPYGIEVDLVAGKPTVVETGPLPLSLDAVSYPVISGDQAVRSVLSSSAPAANSSIPTVRLTKAELVYVLVWAGDHSFYEPAFLFSGTLTDHGVTHQARVLVPAVAPPFLSP